MSTAVEVRPHQCQAQGDNPFPRPAGHAISDTSQDAVGLLGHLGILPAHIQLAVDQHPQVLFCWAASQPLFPKPVALHGVVLSQVQDPALRLVESHTIGEEKVQEKDEEKQKETDEEKLEEKVKEEHKKEDEDQEEEETGRG